MAGVRAAGEASPSSQGPHDSPPPRQRGNSWRRVSHVQPAASPEAAALAAHPVASDSDEDEREIRIKDLDSGREYNIPKKHTIRDLNTGQLYALCTEDGAAPSSASSPAAASPLPAEHFTDIASGRQLSLEEFAIVLGLQRKEPLPQPPGQPGTTAPGPPAAGAPAGKKARGWLKRIEAKLGRGEAAAHESDASESESPVSTPKVGEGHLLGRASGAASASGRGAVRVSVHRKLHRDLAGLAHVQSLQAHAGVVWTMKFSQSGRFLASAGQDGVVCVWEVAPGRGLPADGAAAPAPAPADANGHEQGEAGEASLVFRPEPHRCYRGHKQDVLDLAWSRSLFLLTASMDKTVRLWHVSMDDCLRVFRHTDFVTALDFHPVDDKHFVSGSIDGKVRLWNIPEQSGRVVDYADVHEMVTAVAFSADGGRAVIGTMKGRCRFYRCTPGFKLEYEAQIDVKNRRGRSARGRKVTGLQFQPGQPASLLITSNDSRVRLYDGYSLRCKFKGLANGNTQIRASFSEAGDWIVCGSDDGSVYVWAAAAAGGGEKSGAYECFAAHADIATVAVFAPAAARRPLPPPPRPAEGAAELAARHSRRGKLSKEEAADAAAAGAAAMQAGGAYGQVLLSAGYDGCIKVFENLAPPQWL